MHAADNLEHAKWSCEPIGERHRGPDILARCFPPGPPPPSASAGGPGGAWLWDPGLQNLQKNM